MVAGKTEFLDDTEIYKRLVETRKEWSEVFYVTKLLGHWNWPHEKCFQGQGDISGDRFDAVLLYAAGAFAGAIFVNGEPVYHKVIKKYVCRAKQGKAQSVHDQQDRLSAVFL